MPPVSSTPDQPATLYRHEGSDPVDATVWPDSGQVNADGAKLYTFTGDKKPGDAKGTSDSWVIDQAAPPSTPGTPAVSEPEPQPEPATAEVVGTGDAPTDDEPAPSVPDVVLVPADWTVNAVTFAHGERTDENGYDNSLTVAREPRFVVAEDEADAIIASAGAAGFGLTKETVA